MVHFPSGISGHHIILMYIYELGCLYFKKLITKNMRTLSLTAVSTHCRYFWNTYLIPCYCYPLTLYCNDHDRCACPHMLSYSRAQPHPICSFCNHRQSPLTLKPESLPDFCILAAPSWLSCLGCPDAPHCSESIWKAAWTDIMVCPHEISQAKSTRSTELNYLQLAFSAAQSPNQSEQKTLVSQHSVLACFLPTEVATISSNECHYR